MKLLFATGNIKKFNLMKERLKEFNKIEVVMPKELGINVKVEENGTTAEENAILKAKAYYEKTKMPVISEDSGLWVEKFSKENQPGLFVKRVKGKEGLSNEEILNHYITCLKEVGGESKARYKTGVALIDEKGNLHSITIEEKPFLLTTKKSPKEYLDGGILDIISFDLNSKKYFNELTEDERRNRYKVIDKEIKNIIKTAF